MTPLLLAALIVGLVVGVAVLVRPSDAELHHAADQERRRRNLEGLVERQRRRERSRA